MAFSDYSATPASNTTIGGAIFIGPNMQRGDVREALQQLAADGRSLSDVVVDAGLLTATPPENYFTTRAAGAAATATDALFSSDEEGAMAVYRRTGVVPNYTKLYEVATKAQVDAKAATATLSASSGSAGIGSVRSEAGATAMTMEARVRQQFALVGDFGIVGTEVGGGAQNDRTALIAALNCGATFLIPEDFTIRSAAAITSADLLVPFNVLGQSRTTSRVFFDVNGVGLTTTTSAAKVSQPTV